MLLLNLQKLQMDKSQDGLEFLSYLSGIFISYLALALLW